MTGAGARAILYMRLTKGLVCTKLGCGPREAQGSGKSGEGSRWVSHLVEGAKEMDEKKERGWALEGCWRL